MTAAPGSPEWLRTISASKVAAILGVSTWDSPRSMWHKMRGEVPNEEATKVQARGHYLEPAILAWWRDQHPDYHDHVDQPTFTLSDWAVATPDASCLTHADDLVIVEAKSARDMDEWGDPGTDVIPVEYLTQCYWQLHLSGALACFVPVIGPYLDFYEYIVEPDPDIGSDLEKRMRVFYDSLSADEPPPLDDTTATYDVIRKQHPDIDRGVSVQLAPAEAREYVEAMNGAKAGEARQRAAKSMVLERMGRAQYAACYGVRVARRQPNPTGVQINQVAKSTDQIPDQEPIA